MANILVTGAAGFLGHQLWDALCAQGHATVGVDDLSVTPVIAPPPGLVRMDVRALAPDFLRRHRIEEVVHLAAKKSVSASFRHLDHAVENFEMSLRLLDACAQAGVRRVYQAGTCEMYGDSTTTLDEQSAYSPLSPYAVSKVAGEHLAEVYMRRAPGMRVTSLRFFNIYGPTEGTDAVIPSFVTRTLRGEPILIEGDGTQARDFTYIDDAICAISSIINDKTRYHRSINISSGQTHTIRELAEAVRSLLPWLQIRHTEGRPNEIRSFPSDSALLRECYRFQPRHTLAEGIAEVIRFYRPATEQPATLRCAL